MVYCVWTDQIALKIERLAGSVGLKGASKMDIFASGNDFCIWLWYLVLPQPMPLAFRKVLSAELGGCIFQKEGMASKNRCAHLPPNR